MTTASRNPYRAERLHGLPYQFDDTTWPELLARCAELKFRCTIVGPQGSGKTTLLLELSRRLSGVVFVDGYDSLSAAKRLWMRYRYPRLIVTSHQACALPTLIVCKARPDVLAWAVNQLSGEALSIETAAILLGSHGQNMRNALRHLYDKLVT